MSRSFSFARFRSVLPIVAASALAACGPPPPATCVAGTQIACACAGGRDGTQRCGSDGAFGACLCETADGGPSGEDAAVEVVDAAIDSGQVETQDGGRPDSSIPSGCQDELDLLLMVDNSNSMSEEQASLAAELPRLVRVLASGDRDEDGVRDFPPLPSIQIGVVSSDMGVGGFGVPTCDGGAFGAMFGDDGVLRTSGNTTITGCASAYPSVLAFGSGDDPSAYASDVACVATMGIGGCGFEQQLEAVLKALSPSAPQSWTAAGYVAPTFFSATLGHAIGANAGLVRPDSVLAALVVTDEEDCSAQNPELFNPTSATYGGTDLNLRCFEYPEAVHPVARFVTGLSGLRTDPSRLVFSVIAGVPTDLTGSTAAEYDTILADDRMVERVDPTTEGTRLVPSCNTPGRGIAFPPRRIVSTARGLDTAGAQTSVSSICQESFSPAIDALIDSIATAADCR
ncbi:MAG: hypothetical protein M3Y87_00155 [Myxococcota bacterium]|nr:hypothetical protein [Myxococcota bacterium]